MVHLNPDWHLKPCGVRPSRRPMVADEVKTIACPASTETTRPQPDADESTHDYMTRLSARQPEFAPAENTHNIDSAGVDQLENWLKKSPDYINQYVEDHLIDALLKSHFQRY